MTGTFEYRLKELDKTELKIEKLEKLKEQVKRLEGEISKALQETTLHTPSGIPRNTRVRNVFPRSDEWRNDFQVLEVTGKRNGQAVQAKWFAVDEWELAMVYLQRSLHRGNIWISEAWMSKDEIMTGKRKRAAIK